MATATYSNSAKEAQDEHEVSLVVKDYAEREAYLAVQKKNELEGHNPYNSVGTDKEIMEARAQEYEDISGERGPSTFDVIDEGKETLNATDVAYSGDKNPVSVDHEGNPVALDIDVEEVYVESGSFKEMMAKIEKNDSEELEQNEQEKEVEELDLDLS